MSLTETPAAAPVEKPKRKQIRRRRVGRTVTPRAAAEPSEFEGLTRIACCDACKPDRCAISGINVCAHPFKGGLQSGQQHDGKMVARVARAREYVKDQ